MFTSYDIDSLQVPLINTRLELDSLHMRGLETKSFSLPSISIVSRDTLSQRFSIFFASRPPEIGKK